MKTRLFTMILCLLLALFASAALAEDMPVLPEPTFQLLTENPASQQYVVLSMETSADAFEYWVVRYVDETTGEVNPYYNWYQSYTSHSELTFWTEYAGEYTVYASYFAGGAQSDEAAFHVTVAGTPHPSHGKVPITVTAPEAILAGQDAVFSLDYVEGQSSYFTLYQLIQDDDYRSILSSGYLTNGEPMTVPGYYLEEGETYKLHISSYADDWYSNSEDYFFTVQANPDRPVPPVLTIADKETFVYYPVRFSVDSGWENIRYRYEGNRSSMNWSECNLSYPTITIYDADTVSVYACGLKNGVWSEPSQPVTVNAAEMPQVTEITPYTPTSIRWGEALDAFVLLPVENGMLTLSIDTPEPLSYERYFYSYNCDLLIGAEELILYGLQPGSYTLTYTWSNNGDETVSITRPLEVTGEVKTPITASADRMLAMEGDTVVFSGETGDASSIEVSLSWNSNNGYGTSNRIWLDVEPNSTWSYSVTVPENHSSLYATFRGFTDDGLTTGTQCGFTVDIYDTSLPMPSLQLVTENPESSRYVYVSASAPTDNFSGWNAYVIDETTGETKNVWNTWQQNTELEFYPEYAGEYTLYAAYRTEQKLSAPAELRITVEGTPHPSHGKVPISLTAPETILAGQDAVFGLDYVEGQSFYFNLYQKNENGGYDWVSASNTFTNGLPITVPGYMLDENGIYRLNIYSSADDWYSNNAEYTFSSEENANRPQPPVLGMASEHVYEIITFPLTVDGGWEKIAFKYETLNNGNSGWQTNEPNSLRLNIYSADTVTIIAHGLKNGVWSEVSQPLVVTVEDLPENLTEPMSFSPASIRWGEDLSLVVLFPQQEGRVDFSIDTPNMYSSYNYIYDGIFSDRISGDSLIESGLKTGSYTITYRWKDGDEIQSVSYPLEVTGEEKTPITVTANKNSITAGDTIVYSGETGDASQIRIYMGWGNDNTYNHNSIWLDVEPNSVWSYSVTVPDQDWTYHNVDFYGYTQDGLYTGKTIYLRFSIYDASLPAPTLELLTENPAAQESMRFSVNTAAEGFEDWSVRYVDETNGNESNIWVEYATSAEFSIWPDYAGDYTLFVSYRANGKYSAPAEMRVTVTGRPHPSHGEIPIGFTEPETVLAGRNTVIPVDYVAEGQTYSYSLYKQQGGYGEWISGSSDVSGGQPLEISGLVLDAGETYSLYIYSSAEDWYPNSAEYMFTVSPNPDRPQPPVVAMADENAYTLLPVHLSVDEGWDTLSIRYEGNNSSMGWSEYDPNNVTLRFNAPDTVTVYARGMKEGTWSEESQPLTLTVEEFHVTEITPFTPSSIRWGEDLPIDVILPYDYGTLTISINTAQTWRDSKPLFGNDLRIVYNAGDLIGSGLTPGSYTVTYTWTDGDQTESVTRPLEVTGEVKAPITASADHTTAMAGDTIVFSGETGDASIISIQRGWSINGSWSWDVIELPVEPNSTWSYSVNVPDESSAIYGYFTGRTDDGLATSRTFSFSVTIYDASIPAPALQIVSGTLEAQKTITLSMEAAVENVEEWSVHFVDEFTGGEYWPWIPYQQYAEFNYQPSYAGEYTVYASYRTNGKWSAPAELHFTVTGRPHPTQGVISMRVIAPDAIPAGQDAVFDTKYFVEGQSYTYWLREIRSDGAYYNIYRGSAANGAQIVLPGYVLEEDMTYSLFIESTADDWYNNQTEIGFTPSANDNRPQAPVLTLDDEETHFFGVPVRFSVDEGWDQIVFGHMDSVGGFSWNSFTNNPDNLSITYINGNGRITVCVKGQKNGVWSKASNAVSFEMSNGNQLDMVQIEFMPQLIVGQPFTVTVKPVEHAEWYRMEIWFNDDQGKPIFDEAVRSEEPVLTFDSWNGFDQEGIYNILLSASAEGYNSYSSENRIQIRGVKGSQAEERVFTLPGALKDIEEEAFAGSNATVIVIPNGCRSIGARAFADCESLTKVTIPASVTSIESDAFDGCGMLTIITSNGSAAYDFAVSKGYTVQLTD